jgi:hypothetical protein
MLSKSQLTPGAGPFSEPREPITRFLRIRMLMHPFCVHARAFRVPAVLVTLLLAVSTAGVVGVAGPAGAAPTVATRFHMTGSSIAVAVANGRVFDATADGVVEVFDMAGHLLTSVADEPSAMVMTASSDGSKVFVSLYNSNAVSVIDATTLSEVARYDTSAVGEPGDLVQVDSNLFLTTSNGNVGVIDLTSTASAATRLASAGGLLGGFTARATATPGSDDIYISSCLANISVCNLYRYRYDGSTATLASEVDNVAGRGPVAFDAADNVILAADSPSRDRINVLDPNTLATIWTIAGSAGSSGLLLVGGRIVSGAYDYARNTYATVEVRDLSGALLQSAHFGPRHLPRGITGRQRCICRRRGERGRQRLRLRYAARQFPAQALNAEADNRCYRDGSSRRQDQAQLDRVGRGRQQRPHGL